MKAFLANWLGKKNKPGVEERLDAPDALSLKLLVLSIKPALGYVDFSVFDVSTVFCKISYNNCNCNL